MWTHLPHLARLRPFYTCSRRKFLVGLGLRPNQIYATTYCKPWTDNELLNSELETLSLWSNFYRVICIDLPEEYFKKLQKICAYWNLPRPINPPFPKENLGYMEVAWKRYREQLIGV